MPDPSKYDNQDDFVSACIQQRQDEHPQEDQDQSIAICFSMWENRNFKAEGNVSLNGTGRSHAASLISSGKVNSGEWSFSAADGNKLLGPNGDDWTEYGRWHLGVRAGTDPKTKDHYAYPFGKNGEVYLAALRAAASRASQQGVSSVSDAASALLEKANAKAGKPGKLRADDSSKPYGDVEYADPGYREDGQKRYPIDTEEHIRAAWSYIQHPDNRRFYTAEQLTHIENKIIAAWKKVIDSDGPPSAKSGGSRVVHKVHADNSQFGMEFVLSDATPDRYDDVIVVDGWDLRNFRNNPIALFNHDPNFPIGRWENLSVRDGALRGHLRMAPEGTSARIDEIRKLIEAKILRAVSVGFRPIETEPRRDAEFGNLYKRSELVETSLVAVPANPNALSVARSLKISDGTMKMVFAKHGMTDRSSQVSGRAKHGETPPVGKNPTMTTPISVRVEETQNRIVALRDELTKHLETVDDTNPDDAQTAITETFTQQIEAQEKQLEVLKKAEQHLAKAAATASEITLQRGTDFQRIDRGSEQQMIVHDARLFPTIATKIKPEDYMWRALTIAVKHHCSGKQQTMVDVLKATYGEDERTYHMMNVLNRTNSTVATTTGSKWADSLVQTVYGAWIQSLMPVSVYPKLAAKGQSLTFGTAGTVTLPKRTTTTTVGGGFVLQGDPIPVKSGAFDTVSLTPKKLAVITTFTREIANHSTPAIEGLLRQAILEDTAVAIDTELLSDTAATTTTPGGIRAGVTEVAASSGTAGSIDVFVKDIKAMVGALITATKGNLRAPVWIMNPGDALLGSLMMTTSGDMPFKAELAAGTLNGIPVIQSTTGCTDMWHLVDAADFVTATGDAPQFMVSDQAVLHMDTSPTQLSGNATATPVAMAYPVRSLFQTDSLAIRMIMDVSWGLLRTGTVQWQDAMVWRD